MSTREPPIDDCPKKGPVKFHKRSHRIGCTASMRLMVDKRSKKVLVIKDLNQEHNHELVTPDVGHYPEDRQAIAEEIADIKRLKGLGVTSGKIALNLLKETGKLFTPNDIGNMAQMSMFETWSGHCLKKTELETTTVAHHQEKKP